MSFRAEIFGEKSSIEKTDSSAAGLNIAADALLASAWQPQKYCLQDKVQDMQKDVCQAELMDLREQIQTISTWSKNFVGVLSAKSPAQLDQKIDITEIEPLTTAPSSTMLQSFSRMMPGVMKQAESANLYLKTHKVREDLPYLSDAWRDARNEFDSLYYPLCDLSKELKTSNTVPVDAKKLLQESVVVANSSREILNDLGQIAIVGKRLDFSKEELQAQRERLRLENQTEAERKAQEHERLLRQYKDVFTPYDQRVRVFEVCRDLQTSMYMMRDHCLELAFELPHNRTSRAELDKLKTTVLKEGRDFKSSLEELRTYSDSKSLTDRQKLLLANFCTSLSEVLPQLEILERSLQSSMGNRALSDVFSRTRIALFPSTGVGSVLSMEFYEENGRTGRAKDNFEKLLADSTNTDQSKINDRLQILDKYETIRTQYQMVLMDLLYVREAAGCGYARDYFGGQKTDLRLARFKKSTSDFLNSCYQYDFNALEKSSCFDPDESMQLASFRKPLELVLSTLESQQSKINGLSASEKTAEYLNKLSKEIGDSRVISVFDNPTKILSSTRLIRKIRGVTR
jgi:hypothetical protein